MSRDAPRKSRVQFGETTHDSVNPIPHMWVRAGSKYLDTAVDMLKGFINAGAPMAPLLPGPPCGGEACFV